MAESRPWLFTVIPSLTTETLLHTARRSFAEAPTEYRFTIAQLFDFLQSNYDVVAIAGEYASDAAAASGGVSIGEVYELTAANIYGLPAGILKKRIS